MGIKISPLTAGTLHAKTIGLISVALSLNTCNISPLCLDHVVMQRSRYTFTLVLRCTDALDGIVSGIGTFLVVIAQHHGRRRADITINGRQVVRIDNGRTIRISSTCQFMLLSLFQ